MVARPEQLRVQSLKFQGAAYEALLKPLMRGEYGKIPQEVLVEGPTGTGKSVLLAAFCKYYMRAFPKSNLLVMRKVKADLAGSFMQMWEEEILDWSDPWDRWMLTNGSGGQVPSARSRDVYKYPNGSKIWCRGMDQWARVKSMAYDVIWPMEGTEFEEAEIEGLHTRKRKRVGVEVPFRILMGDVNPEFPQHWWNQRAIRGESVRIKTTLKDNPGYYDLEAREFTAAGREYREELHNRLGGHRYQRYVLGEWVSAEGQILDFAPAKHLFRGKVEHRSGALDRIVFDETHPVHGDYVEIVGWAASYDWGDRHAGTLQVWGVDKEGRQYLVEEVYHSKRPLHWWADWAMTLWKKYGLQFIVCDSAAIDTRNHFNQELQKIGGATARIAISCDKRSGPREASNLEVLREAFAHGPERKPSVFIREGALAHAPDKDLAIQRFQDEIPGWIYAPYEPGRHTGRPEDKPSRQCVDDGLDACCYFRVHMLGGRSVAEKLNAPNETQDPWEIMKRHYWEKAA